MMDLFLTSYLPPLHSPKHDDPNIYRHEGKYLLLFDIINLYLQQQKTTLLQTLQVYFEKGRTI